jgi:hypothetical protein
MSDNGTIRMLQAYIEQRVSPRLFLTSFFRLTQDGIHNSEFVEVDIKRGEPRIAIPVPSISSGARKVEASKHTNKKFKPPVYDLETTISAWSTAQRQVGQDPFQDPNFRRAARDEAFRNLGELEDMIRRAVEVQGSQILSTGTVTLKDEDNATVYTLDFEAKTTHFTTPTAWAADGNTGDPLANISDLAEVIRRDGKQVVTDLVFGRVAMQRFLANAKVKAILDNLGQQRFAELKGAVARPDNVHDYGSMSIDGYLYRLWTYDDYYIDPVSGNPTPYVAENKVLLIAAQGRRDLTFGSIPMFMPPDARAMQFMPPRMTSIANGFDLTTNVWVTPDGKHLTLSAGTRPLCVPTAIDTFGAITTH